ncbi:fimbrial protein [uncultured Acinetobacter sp.]|uniref:fimbrial protein n=1 Tax=uncultured Acinetobacter sp. TaxID=165433 RepID=UPI00258A38CD|nr:fimbrial protein [uncultured Acinetobacter sp.]
MTKYNILNLSLFSFTLLSTFNAQAACQQVDWQTGVYYTGYSNTRSVTQTEDGHAAKITAGNVHLMDIAIQPLGSLLSTTSVPPTNYKIRNANANSILWACSPGTDMSQIRFLTSVNGDDRVGGFFPVDPTNAGGETNVFYTWFAGVGIRQVMGTNTLGRQWTEIPIEYENGTGGTSSGKDICQNGWSCIRLKHLPNLRFELIRVAGYPPYDTSTGGSHNRYCNDQTPSSGVTGDLRALGQSGNYNCAQPTSYITLGHTGSTHPGGSETSDNLVSFPHDTVGVTHTTDSSTWRFWGADNGFGYTLYNAAFLINDSVACKLKTVTPYVDFNTTTANELNSGAIVSRNFSIDVDCNDNVETTDKSGTSTGKIAIGIQPSQRAYTAAQNYTGASLLTSENAVKALLDNNYGATGVAKNVGIYIKYQGANNYLNLLGQPGSTGTFPATTRDVYNSTCGATNNQICYPAITYAQGANAGWYPVLNSGWYTKIGTPITGYSTYRTNYTADLKRIEGAPEVTSGSISSTAYVVVKIQ